MEKLVRTEEAFRESTGYEVSQTVKSVESIRAAVIVAGAAVVGKCRRRYHQETEPF